MAPKQTLLERMMASGHVKAEVLEQSSYFRAKDAVTTELPILNVAFSGALDGGLVPGLTVLAGPSKSFKTLLGLLCMKAYMDKYPDAIVLFYDSEFGVTPEYLTTNGIDGNRVVHIPVMHVEQLKFDMVGRLEEIQKGDRVYIFIDSIGNLASKKEVEDAVNEKSVGDMSRAKAIKSLWRIVTPHLTIKDIPCVAINHIYMTMDMYPKAIVSGGSGIVYSANQIFIITKSQIKNDSAKDKHDQIEGYQFTITIEKSRYVREKAKLPFRVTYTGGVDKYSGIQDIAMAGGFIVKPNAQRYALVDQESGEVGKGVFQKDINPFLEKLLHDEKFMQFVRDRYRLGSNLQLGDDEIEPLAGTDVVVGSDPDLDGDEE